MTSASVLLINTLKKGIIYGLKYLEEARFISVKVGHYSIPGENMRDVPSKFSKYFGSLLKMQLYFKSFGLIVVSI